MMYRRFASTRSYGDSHNAHKGKGEANTGRETHIGKKPVEVLRCCRGGAGGCTAGRYSAHSNPINSFASTSAFARRNEPGGGGGGGADEEPGGGAANEARGAVGGVGKRRRTM